MTEKIKTVTDKYPPWDSSDSDQGEHDKLVTVGSKVTKNVYSRLRWLAYMKDSTVSAIVAEYISRCIQDEDFTRYQPPDQ